MHHTAVYNGQTTCYITPDLYFQSSGLWAQDTLFCYLKYSMWHWLHRSTGPWQSVLRWLHHKGILTHLEGSDSLAAWQKTGELQSTGCPPASRTDLALKLTCSRSGQKCLKYCWDFFAWFRFVKKRLKSFWVIRVQNWHSAQKVFITNPMLLCALKNT